MSNIGKQALRDIAESIEREEWEVLDNGDDEYQVIVKGSLEKGETYRSYQPVSNEISERKIAAFIAAFSPATALALLDDLEAAEHTAAVDHEAACSLVEENEEVKRKLAAAEKRMAELESDKSRMMDALHAAVALNSAGISLNDFDECVLRMHEWGALPDYCIALYVDFIHGFVSESKLLDFGYINDHGAFSARQAEKRIAELQARTVTIPPQAPENLASCLDGYERWLIATTFRDTWNACLAEVARMNTAPPAHKVSGEYGDAYQGAREDLAIWKRRALEAEERARQLEQINDHLVKEAQGEHRFGEPVIRESAPASVPDEVISAIENLKRTLVNCNRYNYCSDAVKRLEGACRAAMLQGADRP